MFPGLLPYLLIVVTMGVAFLTWVTLRWIVRITVWDYRNWITRRSAIAARANKLSKLCCGEWVRALDEVHEDQVKLQEHTERRDRQRNEQLCKQVFDTFDRDGTGDMDMEELETAYNLVIEWLGNKAAKRKSPQTGAAAQAKLQRLWQETDENGDGRVTLEEFTNMCHRMMEGEDILGEVEESLWEKLQRKCRKVFFPHEEKHDPIEVKTMAKGMDDLKRKGTKKRKGNVLHTGSLKQLFWPILSRRTRTNMVVQRHDYFLNSMLPYPALVYIVVGAAARRLALHH